MMVNKDYFGKLSPPKLRTILQQYSGPGKSE
jgi:NADH:ubiquinone oxidoreductase subunit E